MNRIFVANVKEHATLSAGASVDHGVDAGITKDHVNRAADRGCCVSTLSLGFGSLVEVGIVSSCALNLLL